MSFKIKRIHIMKLKDKKQCDVHSVVGQSEQFICHSENIGHSRCVSACGKCGNV